MGGNRMGMWVERKTNRTPILFLFEREIPGGFVGGGEEKN
jgi:hypothetical protein